MYHSSLTSLTHSPQMELCVTKQSLPTIAKLSTTLSHDKPKRTQSVLPFRRRTTPLSSRLITHSSGLFYSTKIRATASEESSSGPNEYVGNERDGPITLETVPLANKNAYNEDAQRESPQEETPMDRQAQSSPQEETPMGEQQQSLEFLENLNIKFELDNSYSLLLYGSGAIVFLWLALAIVGAIDSIPLFPKLMEVVGLGYTVWFSWRYLVFKRNREELAAKINDLKQEVLGSEED